MYVKISKFCGILRKQNVNFLSKIPNNFVNNSTNITAKYTLTHLIYNSDRYIIFFI